MAPPIDAMREASGKTSTPSVAMARGAPMNSAAEATNSARRSNELRNNIVYFLCVGRQGNAWQMLGEEAPVAALVHALMPLAEELDDHLALGVIGFERGDMAVARRLAHCPQFADVIGPEV